MTPNTHHDQLISDYVALWNGEFSNVDAVARSFEYHDPVVTLEGRDELEEYIRETHEAFPDFHTSWEHRLVGEGVVMLEWTLTGTHRGPFQGIPPTGREVTLRGMEMDLIADGKLQEARLYYDTQEITDQLGLGFPAVLGQLPKLALGTLKARF